MLKACDFYNAPQAKRDHKSLTTEKAILIKAACDRVLTCNTIDHVLRIH